MSIFSSLKRSFQGPEARINQLAQAVLSACAKDIPDSQSLAALKVIADSDITIQERADVLKRKIRGRPPTPNEEIQNYIVATEDTILYMLGDCPNLTASRVVPQMDAVLADREATLNFNALDQDILRDALNLAVPIKSWWMSCEDLRAEGYAFTQRERWAMKR